MCAGAGAVASPLQIEERTPYMPLWGDGDAEATTAADAVVHWKAAKRAQKKRQQTYLDAAANWDSLAARPASAAPARTKLRASLFALGCVAVGGLAGAVLQREGRAGGAT